MNILNRYLLKEFFKIFLLLMVGFITIYTVVDSIERANRFAEGGLDLSTVAAYMLLQIPEIVSLVTPVAVLIATILTIGIMNNRNELVALKSAGISLIRFTLPILLCGAVISISMIILNEMVVPYTKAQTNYIKDVLARKSPPKVYYKEKFWHKGHNSIYEVGSYEVDNMVLSDVTYYHFDRQFSMDIRIDAARAQYMGDRWRFFAGLMQERQDGGKYSATAFAEKDMILPEKPDDFIQLAKPSSEMNFSEMYAFIRKIESEGYDAKRYVVDMHSKLSMSVACFITILLGIPLGLMRGQSKESSIARAIVIGAGLSFFYWVGSGMINSYLGYSGILPGALAAWMINIFYTLLALWLYSHVPQ